VLSLLEVIFSVVPGHRNYRVISRNNLKYLKFNCFLPFEDRLNHIFTTRTGGVSKGYFYSLNLGIRNTDDFENVRENFRIVCDAAGFATDSLVYSYQVHGDNIKIIRKEDNERGRNKNVPLEGFDGFITNDKSITLVTFHADCAPVFLYDPVANVAGLAHSGWKGTLLDISGKMVRNMNTVFGCKSEDIIAAIGPSIGKCCFEVQKDVYEKFREKYIDDRFYRQVSDSRWFIDLKGIIRMCLRKSGLKKNNIHDCQICTRCNNDMFFSYRGDSGKTGSLAAFMQLRR